MGALAAFVKRCLFSTAYECCAFPVCAGLGRYLAITRVVPLRYGTLDVPLLCLPLRFFGFALSIASMASRSASVRNPLGFALSQSFRRTSSSLASNDLNACRCISFIRFLLWRFPLRRRHEPGPHPHSERMARPLGRFMERGELRIRHHRVDLFATLFSHTSSVPRPVLGNQLKKTLSNPLLSTSTCAILPL